MPPTEKHRKQIEAELERQYSLLTEYDWLITSTTSPLQREERVLERDKVKAKIAQLVTELEGRLPPVDVSMVRAYLDALENTFKNYKDPKELIPLRMIQGQIAPEPFTPTPEPLEDIQERLRTMLNPNYSPVPPSAVPEPDTSKPEVSVEDFLAEHTRITLLGTPGAGKSTTLRRLVNVFGEPWQSATTDSQPSTPIPIFAALNVWQGPTEGLVSFLQGQIKQLEVPELAKQLPELMAAGRIVLLLDGLNELPQIQRNKETGLINDPRAGAVAELGERAEWSKVQCVLSCRVKDFAGDPQWHDLHVLPLSLVQVATFAKAYYEGVSGAEDLVQGLISELYGSKNERKQRLQGLADHPFYLVRFLSYYYDQRTLPENPALLLKFSLKETLEREIQAGNVVQEEAEELLDRLKYLAFKMTQKSALDFYFLIEESEIRRWFYDTLPYKAIKYRSRNIEKITRLLNISLNLNFLIKVDGRLQFSHQIFQEFFCAYYCQSKGLSLMLINKLNRYYFEESINMWLNLDPNLVNNIGTFVQRKSVKILMFLYYFALAIFLSLCILLILMVNIQTIQWVANSIGVNGFIISDSSKNTFESILWTLYFIILAVMIPFNKVIYISNTQLNIACFLSKIRNPEVLKYLFSIISHRNSEVRVVAVEGLSQFDESKVKEALISALKDKNKKVCHASIKALVELNAIEAIPHLEFIRQNDRGVATYTFDEGSKFVVKISEEAARAIQILEERHKQVESP